MWGVECRLVFLLLRQRCLLHWPWRFLHRNDSRNFLLLVRIVQIVSMRAMHWYPNLVMNYSDSWWICFKRFQVWLFWGKKVGESFQEKGRGFGCLHPLALVSRCFCQESLRLSRMCECGPSSSFKSCNCVMTYFVHKNSYRCILSY